MFYADEEAEASENKAAEEWISKIEEASFSSKARTGDHEVLVREVSALPQERRRSLLSSILDRLIKLDVNESTNENWFNCLTSKKKENGIGDGQHLSTAQKGSEKKYTTTKDQDNNKTQEGNFEAGSPDGIDNNGFDGDGIESRPWSPDPDQITGTNVNQIYTNYVASKSPEMDRSTTLGSLMENNLSVDSPDPETALPATSSPKTVRAWLKDPHLYKVIYC